MGLSNLVVRKIRKGKTILRQGTHGTSAFIIKRGKVAVWVPDASGHRKVLNVLQTNDLFGEMAMISSQPRCASVTALEDCELAVLTKTRFLSLPSNSTPVLRIKKIMLQRMKQNALQTQP